MMLTGTAMGRVNMPDDGTHKADLAGYFQQSQDTIFDRLTDEGIHWKCYFDDIPQSWTLDHQRLPHNAARYFYISEFFKDALGCEEDFPQFSFIEPDFMGVAGNDDHPPHDIMKAEKLIADVYNALRANSDLWNSILLVIIYDEHGGFYDHVVPPAAVPPDDHHEEYSFNQLGLRVSALLVSPWVGRRIEKTQFDHTSLLNYLTEKWQLTPLPSKRMAQATSVAVALQVQRRDNLLPRIELTADQLTPPNLDLEEAAIADNSTHDQALTKLKDYVVEELSKAAPNFYSKLRGWFEIVKSFVWRAPTAPANAMALDASIAQPDKLGGANVRVKDGIAQALMTKKSQAVAVLAQHMRDTTLSEARRRHAAQTLELITGRRFHASTKVTEAEHFLQLHGR
jgi:phospholipase C